MILNTKHCRPSVRDPVSGRPLLFDAIEYNQNEIVNYIIKSLEKNELVNIKDLQDNDILMIAIASRNIQAAKSILEKVPESIISKNVNGKNALMLACEKGLDDLVTILLQNGAILEDTDINGQTPLHYAISFGHLNIAQSLINKGATLKPDSKGFTPLDYAYSHKILDCINGKNLLLILRVSWEQSKS